MSLDDATFDAILRTVTAGLPVREAIRKHGGNNDAFYERLGTDAEFAERYARAKDAGLEAWSDESIDIADEEPRIEQTKFGEKVDAGFEQWRKTRIETRKWHLEKLRPKRYGNRTILAGDADNPLAFVDQSAIAGKLLPELAAGGAPATPGDPDEA